MNDKQTDLADRLRKAYRKLEIDENRAKGPGAFKHLMQCTSIRLRKNTEDMTEAEREFLLAPPPAKRH